MERMEKQTAVEWLLYSLARNNIAAISVAESIENEHRIIEQAKEMEKEQMKSSYNDGKRDAYKQDDVPTYEEYIYQKYGI